MHTCTICFLVFLVGQLSHCWITYNIYFSWLWGFQIASFWRAGTIGSALVKDQGLDPSIQPRLTTICNFDFRVSSTLFWLLQVLHARDTYICSPNTHTHEINVKTMCFYRLFSFFPLKSDALKQINFFLQHLRIWSITFLGCVNLSLGTWMVVPQDALIPEFLITKSCFCGSCSMTATPLDIFFVVNEIAPPHFR